MISLQRKYYVKVSWRKGVNHGKPWRNLPVPGSSWCIFTASSQSDSQAVHESQEQATFHVYTVGRRYPNVDHPKRQISEPTFSSFCVRTTKNQRLLHAIKYCFIYIKYWILYVLYCIVMVTILEKPLDFMHRVASRFGYPNYRLSQLVRIIDLLLYFHLCKEASRHYKSNIMHFG